MALEGSKITLINEGQLAVVERDPYIRLEQGARLVKSSVEGGLKLGRWSYVGNCLVRSYLGVGDFSAILHSSVGRYCTFGNRVSIGGFNHPMSYVTCSEMAYRDTTELYGVSFLDSDLPHNRENQATISFPRVIIENDVWIGDNAVVLSGVSIATGAVIGAGAVVTKDVAPYSIVVGNPARVLKYRFSEDIIARLIYSKWWELPFQELVGVDLTDPKGFLSSMERADHLKKSKI